MLVAIVAGVPPEIGNQFASAFHREYSRRFEQSELLLSWRPLHLPQAYTQAYAKELYCRMSDRLRRWEESRRRDVFERANLVLFYLDKGDHSEAHLLKWFGTEALLIPLRMASIDGTGGVGDTENQRNQAVNRLVTSARRQFVARQALLGVIGEEVRTRDNKTCLLLPKENFGRDINRIFAHVQRASRAGTDPEQFREKLRDLEQSLDTVREGGYRYFRGRGRLLFKAPAKAGARHGLSPGWNAQGHRSPCVIRGRVRFGAA